MVQVCEYTSRRPGLAMTRHFNDNMCINISQENSAYEIWVLHVTCAGEQMQSAVQYARLRT